MYLFFSFGKHCTWTVRQNQSVTNFGKHCSWTHVWQTVYEGVHEQTGKHLTVRYGTVQYGTYCKNRHGSWLFESYTRTIRRTVDYGVRWFPGFSLVRTYEHSIYTQILCYAFATTIRLRTVLWGGLEMQSPLKYRTKPYGVLYFKGQTWQYPTIVAGLYLTSQLIPPSNQP